MNRQEFFEKLKSRDPYEVINLDHHPDDMQGWNSTHPNFRTMLEHYRPSLVVEVGSWKGASAHNMATIAKEIGLNDLKIVCVDTWLGSIEHRHYDQYHASLREETGYPAIFYTFVANMKRHGLQDTVFPFPNSSAIAAAWFKQQNIQPDLVFVDGSHDFESVYNDSVDWYNIVRPGGAIFGDDYSFDTVARGLRLFSRVNGVDVKPLDHVQWVATKPNHREARRAIDILAETYEV